MSQSLIPWQFLFILENFWFDWEHFFHQEWKYFLFFLVHFFCSTLFFALCFKIYPKAEQEKKPLSIARGQKRSNLTENS